MSRAIRIAGFKVKDGKIQRDPKRLDVSARLRQRASKKVRVARRKP
jgi:hypothetical protein